MKSASVTIRLQGKKWEISGNYIPRNAEHGQPSRFDVKHISQVDGGDVATLLVQYEEEEIAQVALREFEEEQAYQIKEQAA
jgi:hypothetical protein